MKMVHRLLLLLGCSVAGVGLACYLAMLLDAAPQGSKVGPPKLARSKGNQQPLWADASIPPHPDAAQIPSESPKPQSTPSAAPTKPAIHFPPIPAMYRRETFTRNSLSETPIPTPFQSDSSNK